MAQAADSRLKTARANLQAAIDIQAPLIQQLSKRFSMSLCRIPESRINTPSCQEKDVEKLNALIKEVNRGVENFDNTAAAVSKAAAKPEAKGKK